MDCYVIAIISKIRQKANDLIISELKKADMKDLSPSHGDILAVLYKNDNIATNLIAKKIRKTKATTTVLIDKLEKNGFVRREKSANDSRITNILLTKKGRDFKSVFEKISQKLNKTAFEGFKDEEIKELENILRKVEKNLN